MDFSFKKGIILSKRLANANYFLTRILPDMVDIQEVDLLPTFPCFFGEDNLAYKPDDEVWVLTNDDFTTGYILGHYQNPLGGYVSPIFNLVKEAEEKSGFNVSNAEDISIRSIGGKSILFENIANGQSGQIFNNKVVHIYSSLGESFMMYPNLTIKIDKQGNSYLKGKNKKEDVYEVETNATSITQNVGQMKTVSKGSIIDIASGPIKESTASYKESATVGDSTELVAKKKSETYGLGLDTKIVAGGHTENILAGSYTINVVGGRIELTSGLGVSINSPLIDINGTSVNINSPSFKAPAIGSVTPGLGPFCALPFCVMTGAPHTGNIQLGGI